MKKETINKIKYEFKTGIAIWIIGIGFDLLPRSRFKIELAKLFLRLRRIYRKAVDVPNEYRK